MSMSISEAGFSPSFCTAALAVYLKMGKYLGEKNPKIQTFPL